MLGYKTSIHLVFSFLFRLIVLYFSFNSNLILGGGECNIHLVHCHLESSMYFLNLSTILDKHLLQSILLLSLVHRLAQILTNEICFSTNAYCL